MATIESEAELVEVVVEVLVTDRPLMSAAQPALQQRDHQVHQSERFANPTQGEPEGGVGRPPALDADFGQELLQDRLALGAWASDGPSSTMARISASSARVASAMISSSIAALSSASRLQSALIGFFTSPRASLFGGYSPQLLVKHQATQRRGPAAS